MLAFNVSANHRYVQCWQVQEIVFTINAYWLTGSTEVEGNGGSIITANRTDWPQLESHHWIQETCIRSLFIRFIKPHIRLFPHVFILRFYVRARAVWPFPQFIITGSKHTPNDLGQNSVWCWGEMSDAKKRSRNRKRNFYVPGTWSNEWSNWQIKNGYYLEASVLAPATKMTQVKWQKKSDKSVERRELRT